MRAKYATRGDLPGRLVNFWCPGCDQAHTIGVEYPESWGFNGDLERPTITPSVLVHMTKWKGTFEQYGKWTLPTHNVEPGTEATCHSFVTDGRIQFLGDSTHHLAGQTVDLPDWPYAG
jgi:hypothetical protein